MSLMESSEKSCTTRTLISFYVTIIGASTITTFVTIIIGFTTMLLLIIASFQINNCTIVDKQYNSSNGTTEVSLLVLPKIKYSTAVWIKMNYTNHLPKNYTIGESFKCHVSAAGEINLNADKYITKVKVLSIIMGTTVLFCIIASFIYVIVFGICVLFDIYLQDNQIIIDFNTRSRKGYTEFGKEY